MCFWGERGREVWAAVAAGRSGAWSRSRTRTAAAGSEIVVDAGGPAGLPVILDSGVAVGVVEVRAARPGVNPVVPLFVTEVVVAEHAARGELDKGDAGLVIESATNEARRARLSHGRAGGLHGGT